MNYTEYEKDEFIIIVFNTLYMISDELHEWLSQWITVSVALAESVTDW